MRHPTKPKPFLLSPLPFFTFSPQHAPRDIGTRMGFVCFPRFANWGPACRVLVDNISEWFALFFLLYRRALKRGHFESTALLLRLLQFFLLRSAEAASSASRCSTWQLRCKPASPQQSRSPRGPHNSLELPKQTLLLSVSATLR